MIAAGLGFILVLASSSQAGDLTCAEIGTMRDSDGNMTFFQKTEEGGVQVRTMRELQSRIAVRDFYGLCQGGEDGDCYSPSMPIDQVEKLGEGILQYNARGADRTLFRVVNVGFGGGNGASYFFRINSLRLLPWMIVDGSECGPLNLGQRPWSR